MYTAFYGLREKPFALSPDPRFLYLSESHREALAHLLYGVEQREGFIAITGEVGTGKTTLCRTLIGRLGPDLEVAYLFNPSRSGKDLMEAISSELALPSAGLSLNQLHDQLNRFLLEKSRARASVLLIVDEAQNLSVETLEQVRLLSNLETSSSKLIQILLLGQLDDGCITLNDRTLSIQGSMRSQRAVDLMAQRLETIDERGFDVTYEVALPELCAAAQTCQDEANRRVARGETVLFDFDSDALHEDGKALLDEIVEIAALCPEVDVEVSGHTDSVGDKDYNIGLSERRATVVAEYLVNRGMEGDRLSAVGKGFSQPIADNSTEEGRAENRRIEFRAREE